MLFSWTFWGLVHNFWNNIYKVMDFTNSHLFLPSLSLLNTGKLFWLTTSTNGTNRKTFPCWTFWYINCIFMISIWIDMNFASFSSFSAFRINPRKIGRTVFTGQWLAQSHWSVGQGHAGSHLDTRRPTVGLTVATRRPARARRSPPATARTDSST